ncbi:MAG TPA: rhodanese-like domain-containing protein, partial [Gemmatimonadaceae bacterium]|nr:rhodanese-like domain-containing protein [Gemmatimonadaceae bacterium]
AAGHAPGVLNIPLDERFTTWAGWLLPYDRDVFLLVNHAACPHCVEGAMRDLAMIGLDRVAGIFGADALGTWRASGRELEAVPKSTVSELASVLDEKKAIVLDVRGRAEWAAGHLPGSINIPLGELSVRLSELPADKSVVLQCQSGARSAIAASVLQALGRTNVRDLIGGIEAWERAGHPVAASANEQSASIDAVPMPSTA